MTNIQAWLKENWVGIAGVVVVVLGFWWFTNKEERQGLIEPEGLMVGEEVSLLEKKTGLKVGEVGEKIVLESVDGSDASGIATEGSILADLPGLDGGYLAYEGWLVSEETDDVFYAGRLQSVKGGWLLDYRKESPRGYNKVIVTKEKVLDQRPEKHVLEGVWE